MAKTYIKKVILLLIALVEKCEYLNLELNEDDVSKKIIRSLDLEGYQVETDSGWQPITQVHITQPYRMWRLITDSGKTLDCADNHKVFTTNKQEIFVKDLHVGIPVYTKNGYEIVTSIEPIGRSVSMFDVTVDHPDHRYYSNGILSHNTVTSSIFISWYLCFHSDRNIMVVANKLQTTSEIVDKIRTVLKNLPFFMKPGISAGGVTGMRFDNGCRLFSQATTKTAAIGFTIHLLFADEFAHIHPNFLLPFYRSIYPTLSSSQVSRMIICSTPNGMNLFYEIYSGAIERRNNYAPIRVDWWQVPGRDEEWKQREIANLGSEELFNQEYGNQFLASSRLLFDSNTLMLMKRVCKEFICKETDTFLDYPNENNCLKWLPSFDPGDTQKTDHFVFAVDLGDGVGRDYSIINIFNVIPQSIASIRSIKNYEDESSFFRLNQVGLFRSNTHSVEELSKVLELLVFDLFSPEQCKIVLEINYKGNLVYEKLSKNREFYPEIFLHTKHSIANDSLKLGVKIQKDNREIYCRELRNLVRNKKLIVNESRTFDELASFGINSVGRYESQLANDDIAMSCVNLVALYNNEDFNYIIESIYDDIPQKYKTAIENQMLVGEESESDYTEIFKVIGNMEKDGFQHNSNFRSRYTR